MIQQRVGDLLEIEEGGKYFCVVVLTKVVMFGGNILFAFHTEGEKREVGRLAPAGGGFNICADLLLPKREGRVTRLHRYEDVSPFWRSKYVKATNEYRLGVKAKEWFIYNINDLGGQPVARVTELSREYQEAMDSGCHSFDLLAEKVLRRYTPDQNEHI
ncbi:MAG TPA: hypothetical protein VH092_25020 [Urbifossiella sp.]|jgi:hypothetical protein|nr:hypothetical protein [Urbifossiella sp.]